MDFDLELLTMKALSVTAISGLMKRANQIQIREEVMSSAHVRIQRIIKYKFFVGLSWEEVARRMGRKAKADGVRMVFSYNIFCMKHLDLI